VTSSSLPNITEAELSTARKTAHPEILLLRPSRGWSSLGLRDLWNYRELLYFLVWREIQGAYRQTALGMTWIFLRPVINMLLLTFVFGRIVSVPSDGLPYPIFSLAALLPWGFFSNAVMRASRSLVDNTHLISKVYFPRLIIPIAGAASGLVDFGAACVVLLIMLFIYRIPLQWAILWLPLLLVITFAFALATGLWLATLSVKYRDVSFAVNFFIQALMYMSPVIYSASLVPESMKFIYQLNPMTGVIQGFRWALLDSGEMPGAMFILSIALVMAALISGAYIFRRTERTIVDLL
jgi:lipopolysaccharide transport system permease protein